MKKTATIIRMGAANWDASIPDAQGNRLTFDFRKMNRDERRQFHASFMALYRKVNPMKERRAA